jgi:hypothetical protein
MKSKLFIRLHLGLGDSVVCNGLVREMMKKYEDVTIPAYNNNFAQLKYAFRDLGDKLRIMRVTSDKSCDSLAINAGSTDVLKLGFTGDNFKPETWDKSFYEQAGLDFGTRWASFYVERNIPKEVRAPTPRFIFVHDDKLRHYDINPVHFAKGLTVVRPQMLAHIYSWMWCIENAEEIHAIDGPFLALADSIPTKGKLFCHKSVRNSIPPILAKKWEII